MGRSKKNSKKSKGNAAAAAAVSSTTNSSNSNLHYNDASFLWVDPSRVRFQHSRIRPYFSGCGRSVMETLEAIRNHQVDPIYDLPPIQVLVGPTPTANEDDDDQDDGVWYFSLNNRRLWVLKRCLEEGLLEKYDNLIRVRVREPKSRAELERYTVEKCVLHAKLMRESSVPYNNNNNKNNSNNGSTKNDEKQDTGIDIQETTTQTGYSSFMIHDRKTKKENDAADTGMAVASDEDEKNDKDDDSSYDDDDDDDGPVTSNRFAALL